MRIDYIIHEYFVITQPIHVYYICSASLIEEFFILGLLSYCFLCCFSLSFQQLRFCILKTIWFKIFIWKNPFIAVSLFPRKDILFPHSPSSYKIISIWHMIKDISCKVLIFSVTSNNKQKIRHFQILYLSQAIVNIKYVVCALILKNPSIVSKKDQIIG